VLDLDERDLATSQARRMSEHIRLKEHRSIGDPVAGVPLGDHTASITNSNSNSTDNHGIRGERGIRIIAPESRRAASYEDAARVAQRRHERGMLRCKGSGTTKTTT